MHRTDSLRGHWPGLCTVYWWRVIDSYHWAGVSSRLRYCCSPTTGYYLTCWVMSSQVMLSGRGYVTAWRSSCIDDDDSYSPVQYPSLDSRCSTRGSMHRPIFIAGSTLLLIISWKLRVKFAFTAAIILMCKYLISSSIDKFITDTVRGRHFRGVHEGFSAWFWIKQIEDGINDDKSCHKQPKTNCKV